MLSIGLFRIAGKVNSQSLKTDAKNYRMDIITSSGVLVAIIGAYFGLSILDLIIAIIVSFLIFKTALGVVKESLAIILDESPPGLEIEVRKLANQIPDIINIHEFRVRQLGNRITADCHILVDSTISVAAAHMIMNELENAVYSCTSISEILIHVEPNS